MRSMLKIDTVRYYEDKNGHKRVVSCLIFKERHTRCSHHTLSDPRSVATIWLLHPNTQQDWAFS